MKQITIYDLLPLLRKGWVAMDEGGNWSWFKCKPHKREHGYIYPGDGIWMCLSAAINITPFDGDWKDSLMECGK